jgi:hypothetical protein
VVFARQIRLSFGSLMATQVKWVGIPAASTIFNYFLRSEN